MLICQSAIVLVFAILVFGINCRGPFGVVILLALLQGFGGMSFGLMISGMLIAFT